MNSHLPKKDNSYLVFLWFALVGNIIYYINRMNIAMGVEELFPTPDGSLFALIMKLSYIHLSFNIILLIICLFAKNKRVIYLYVLALIVEWLISLAPHQLTIIGFELPELVWGGIILIFFVLYKKTISHLASLPTKAIIQNSEADQ